MNLLLKASEVPTWTWIAIATVILIAIIAIICVIIWASKKSKSKKSATTAERETAVASASAVKEERRTERREEKPVQRSEEQPVKKQPERAQATEKPETKTTAKKEAPAKAVAKPAEEKPATGKVYHISKRKDDGKWQIKAEGATRATKLFNTQKEAIDYAKTLATNQDARIMIHKEDGSFRKLTY